MVAVHTHTCTLNMLDAITITLLAIFFADESKSIQRGENHYKSDHVESCTYFPGELKAGPFKYERQTLQLM